MNPAAYLLTLALLAPLASASAEDVFTDSKQAFSALQGDKAKRTQRVPYEKLISRLLDASKGDGQRADDCAYFAATVAEELYRASGVAGDLDRAVQLNVQVADRFKGSSLADDALWRAAKLLASRKGDLAGARKLLVRARDSYPKGDQAGAIKELLDRLPASAETAAAPAKPARAVDVPQPDTTRDGGVDRIQAILTRYSQEGKDAGPAEADAPKTETAGAAPAPAPAPAAAPVAPSAGSLRAAGPLKSFKSKTNTKTSELWLGVDGPVALASGTAPADGKVPWRFYVDLAPALLGKVGRDLKSYKDDRILKVRTAQYDARTVRVVMELKEAMSAFASMDEAHGRVVISVGTMPDLPAPPPPPPAALAAVVQDAAPAAKEAPAARKEERALSDVKTLAKEFEGRGGDASLSAQAGLKVRRVVIDPGHGGEDPGAIGPTGVKEKEVTLKIAKKVAQRLKKELKMDVVLTRDSDVFIPLEERTAIANKSHADLFISIHANSNPNRRIHGVETYYLNITDDSYSMRLAARENKTSQRSINDLQFILADLAMKSNVDDSVRLSRLVQGNVCREIRETYPNTKDLGVKHALFYVLIGAKMPAILVETSFISNTTEEQRLANNKYQDKVADGLVQGVRNFVEERQALAR